MPNTLDRYAGTLCGVAFGDAYGLPVELARRPPTSEWVSSSSSLTGVEIEGGKIAYSDDTEMTVILAESMIKAHGFDPDVFASELAIKADTGSLLRRYGPTTSLVVGLIRAGIPWQMAAREVAGSRGSPSNGAAIRVSPIPLVYWDMSKVVEMARLQARVTHAHPLAEEGAVVQAVSIRLVLEGVKPAELPQELLKSVKSDIFRRKIELVNDLLDADSPRLVAAKLGNRVEAFNSVPSAVYSFVRGGGDPVKAALIAISLGGDVDSIASMACSLAGSFSGVGRFPCEKLDRIENIEHIKRLGMELYYLSLQRR